MWVCGRGWMCMWKGGLDVCVCVCVWKGGWKCVCGRVSGDVCVCGRGGCGESS